MPKKGNEGAKQVELMQQKFPKFSKVTLCMIRNPAYGVDYSAEAKRFLRKQEPKKPKKPERKRLTVRVSNEIYSEIKKMTEAGSYQELIEKIIADAIGGKHESDS